ncbi:unnamed protein product [Arabis nemorensis]|uniref:Uncharacterized protein n=1 Tax=Arabis nemorensis TaxID=586526 RepID=A0A565CBI7_9BRAS|nr:unnamed protein product [Arabis nemorensis]
MTVQLMTLLPWPDPASPAIRQSNPSDPPDPPDPPDCRESPTRLRSLHTAYKNRTMICRCCSAESSRRRWSPKFFYYLVRYSA